MWVTKKKLAQMIATQVEYEVNKAVHDLNRQVKARNAEVSRQMDERNRQIANHNSLVEGWLKELRDHIMAARSK